METQRLFILSDFIQLKTFVCIFFIPLHANNCLQMLHTGPLSHPFVKSMLFIWNPAVAQATVTCWKGDILNDTLQQVRLRGSRQGSMIHMSTLLTNKPAKHRWHSKFTAVVKSSSSPHFSSANNFLVFQEGWGGVPGYNETHLMRPKCDTAAASSLCKEKVQPSALC